MEFRQAERHDLGTIVDLLIDDPLGAQRERHDLAPYEDGFDRILDEPQNMILVAEDGGRIVATYQLTFISGLSHAATRRAQIESVRVVEDLRGKGIGRALMQDAEARARAAGCGMIQLTTHATRNRARDFYDQLGFTPSHVGYKRVLD